MKAKKQEAERSHSNPNKSWGLITSSLVIVAAISVILLVGGRFFPPTNRIKFLATMGPDVAPEINTQPQFKFDNGGQPYDYFLVALGRNNELLENEIEVQGFQLDVNGAAIDIYRIPLSFRDLDDTDPRIPLDEGEALDFLPHYESDQKSVLAGGRSNCSSNIFVVCDYFIY